jgi:hypothetical protein
MQCTFPDVLACHAHEQHTLLATHLNPRPGQFYIVHALVLIATRRQSMDAFILNMVVLKNTDLGGFGTNTM